MPRGVADGGSLVHSFKTKVAHEHWEMLEKCLSLAYAEVAPSPAPGAPWLPDPSAHHAVLWQVRPEAPRESDENLHPRFVGAQRGTDVTADTWDFWGHGICH